MHIGEFAALTGVSVRTLHYYDEIGLLEPAFIDGGTGYRYYDESSLLTMQEILFYRELDFSLKSIGEILSSPDHDRQKALMQQKRLLTLKKQRLERLIASIDDAVKGENIMSAFDNSEFEKYKAEAREKWGETDAYKEHAEKTANYTKEKWDELGGEMSAIFAQFAQCMKDGGEPSGERAQALVKRLQDHITENYYRCTDEILSGLGQMYACDERFRSGINAHADGTAQFAAKAIEVYCG